MTNNASDLLGVDDIISGLRINDLSGANQADGKEWAIRIGTGWDADLSRDTSLQMKGAVNQRVFDVPLAGGFVLSDNQPDLSELFAMGSEAVSYESLDDCREKIAFYLKNPDARERISSAARRRIQAEHLYLHRAKVILESLL